MLDAFPFISICSRVSRSIDRSPSDLSAASSAPGTAEAGTGGGRAETEAGISGVTSENRLWVSGNLDGKLCISILEI